MSTTYTDVLDDDLTLGAVYPATGYGVELSDRPKVVGTLTANAGATITSTINVHGSQLYAYQAGAVVKETVKIGRFFGLQTKYSVSLTQTLKLASALLRIIPVSLTQNFTIHPTKAVAYAIALAQRLSIKQTDSESLEFSLALAQTILLKPQLAWFWGLGITQGLTIHPQHTPNFLFARGLSSNIHVSSVLANTMFFQLILDDDFDVDDADFVQMLYKGDPLLDTVKIFAGWVDPGGDFTSWAVNTRTGSVSEYQNWVFNSFAKMGNRYLGANSHGLWALDGATDNGANIVSDIKSGMLSLAGSHFTMFKSAYLGMRVRDNAKDFLLKIHTPDGKTYIYAFHPHHMRTTKINLGKGIRTRYFSWELVTPGADWDLDAIEFVPIGTTRRV